MRRMEPEAAKGLRDDIKHAAGKVALTAGANAPRRTGALQHSIRVFVSGARASIGSTLPYAGVVHWGGTIAPKGTKILFRRNEFVTRAIADHQDQIVEDIADGVERAAIRAGWHPGGPR
jgi:phage gpG-like protein